MHATRRHATMHGGYEACNANCVMGVVMSSLAVEFHASITRAVMDEVGAHARTPHCSPAVPKAKWKRYRGLQLTIRRSAVTAVRRSQKENMFTPAQTLEHICMMTRRINAVVLFRSWSRVQSPTCSESGQKKKIMKQFHCSEGPNYEVRAAACVALVCFSRVCRRRFRIIFGLIICF